MAKSLNPKDSDRRQERDRLLALEVVGQTIDKLYADVKKISVTYSQNYHGGSSYFVKDKLLTWSGSRLADFTIRCASRDCVHGGFDLGPVIAAMVEAKAASRQGSEYCQGWEAEVWIGRRRCHTGLEYEITIQ